MWVTGMAATLISESHVESARRSSDTFSSAVPAIGCGIATPATTCGFLDRRARLRLEAAMMKTGP